MKKLGRIVGLGGVAVLAGCGPSAQKSGCVQFGELQIPRAQLLEPGRFPLMPTQSADQSGSDIAISMELQEALPGKRLYLTLTHLGAMKGPGLDSSAIKELVNALPDAVVPDVAGLYRFYRDGGTSHWYLVRSKKPELTSGKSWVLGLCSTVGGISDCLYDGNWREINYAVSLDYTAIAKLGEVTKEIDSNFERWNRCETTANQ